MGHGSVRLLLAAASGASAEISCKKLKKKNRSRTEEFLNNENITSIR